MTFRREAAATILVALGALVLALLPDLATRVWHGEWNYMANSDELLYASTAKAAYYGDSRLVYPSIGPWEDSKCLYARAQFVPFAKVTAWLGLPLGCIGLVWRVFGGILLGATVYWLFRGLLSEVDHAVAWSVACSFIAISDSGLVGNRTILDQGRLVYWLAQGNMPDIALGIETYRIVTPLANLPFVFALLAAFQFREQRFWLCAGVGACSFGACMLLYFFFWTAATIGIGLWFLWNAGRAWIHPNARPACLQNLLFATVVLLGGMALGGMQVYGNWSTFSDPQLRALLDLVGYPIRHGWDDPVRFRYVLNYWSFAKLALGAVGIWWMRAERLQILWCVVFAAYLLSNSAIVTGLEFENYHWYYVFSPVSEIMVLSILSMAASRTQSSIRLLQATCGVAAAMFLIALVWRPYEAIVAGEPRDMAEARAELGSLRPMLRDLPLDRTIAGPKNMLTVVNLESPATQLFHRYTSHALISTESVVERHVLNSWLLGLSKDELFSEFSTMSQTYRQRRDHLIVAGKVWERLEGDQAPSLLLKYRVDYLLAPSGNEPRGGVWELVAKNSLWKLYRRTSDSDGVPVP